MSTAIFAPSSTCFLSVTPCLAGSRLHDWIIGGPSPAREPAARPRRKPALLV